VKSSAEMTDFSVSSGFLAASSSTFFFSAVSSSVSKADKSLSTLLSSRLRSCSRSSLEAIKGFGDFLFSIGDFC